MRVIKFIVGFLFPAPPKRRYPSAEPYANNHSADDPCHFCGKMKNENGFCNCKESWK